MSFARPLAFTLCSLTLAATFGGCRTPRAGGEAKSLGDALVMVHRADGQFDVTCQDGRKEVDSQEKVMSNQVCLAAGETGVPLLAKGVYHGIEGDPAVKATCAYDLAPVYNDQKKLVRVAAARIAGPDCTAAQITFECADQGQAVQCTASDVSPPMTLTDIGENFFTVTVGGEPRRTYGNMAAATGVATPILADGSFAIQTGSDACKLIARSFYNAGKSLSHVLLTRGEGCSQAGTLVYDCRVNTASSELCTSEAANQVRTLAVKTPQTFVQTVSGSTFTYAYAGAAVTEGIASPLAVDGVFKGQGQLDGCTTARFSFTKTAERVIQVVERCLYTGQYREYTYKNCFGTSCVLATADGTRKVTFASDHLNVNNGQNASSNYTPTTIVSNAPKVGKYSDGNGKTAFVTQNDADYVGTQGVYVNGGDGTSWYFCGPLGKCMNSTEDKINFISPTSFESTFKFGDGPQTWTWQSN